jgi:hypothetical protein
MSNFTDGAPKTYLEWLQLGFVVIPCNKQGIPMVQKWQQQIINLKTHKLIFAKGSWDHNVIALRLDDLVDIDIDNPIVQLFLSEIFCGAMFGRRSNPISHLLYKGQTENKSFIVPKEFEKYFKQFKHGLRLIDIRSGNDHFTYVPNGITPEKKGFEKLEWTKFTDFKEFDPLMINTLSEICLFTALSIMFPATGQRDEYVTSIAGVLAKHTEWTDEKIGRWCFKLAFKSGSDNPDRYSIKGTNARKEGKHFGIPKLAEILEVPQSAVAKLFSWVGVADTGSNFSKLKVYETDPTMWKIKYKDTWITIMDSSHLLSWTKMSIHILENCYEVPTPMKPAEWKATINSLLNNVEKIKVDKSESYFGQIGSVINDFLNRDDRFDDEMYNEKKALKQAWGCWWDKENNFLYFRLESLVMKINDARLKYEQRKLTQFIRDEYKAEPTKLNIEGKDIRCWRAPVDMIRSQNNKVKTNNSWQNYEHNSSDTLKSNSEKKYISDMAWKKKRRKEQQELQDERMKKLQLEQSKELDNY